MKKRILTSFIAAIMLFLTVNVSCVNDINEDTFIWGNYFETAEAYVSDIYYYNIPNVQDEAGTTYEVSVEVADSAGNEVDSFGGFFLVEKSGEYKITYSIDNGKNIYSKTTTVMGIEKAKYELADENLIFGVNEVVDLEGKIKSSISGEITYSAKKGEKSIALENNTFMPTEKGIYTVQAKLEKQPTYSFNIYVVDRAEYPYADGMILDGINKEDISVVQSFEDLKAEILFDEAKKYDSQSNGAYKIDVKTTGIVEVDGQKKQGVAETRRLDFSLKPAYGSEYYKMLEKSGYKYIAIRYMIETSSYDGTTRLDYISSSGKDEMAIYYGGSKVVNKSAANGLASYTYWNYQLDKVPVGAWAEMLLDISKFTTYYNNQELSLFQLVVNKNSYWDMTMYIDNIYAVKGEAVSTADTKVVEKGTEVDLETLSVDTGIENAIRSTTYDGELISVIDNKLKIEEYGLYSVNISDRTMYGSINQNIIAKGTVVSNTSQNFSAIHKTSTTTSNYTAVKTEDKIVVSSGGAGKIDRVGVTTYSVKLCGEKSYYEALQKEGYAYITYEYTLSFTGTASSMIYRYGFVTADAAHTNSMGAISYPYVVSDGGAMTDTSTREEGKQGFLSTSYPDTWNGKTFTVSIPIQTIIDNYTPTIRILAFYFSSAAVEMDYNVMFGKIFPTKEACSFENN